MRSKIEGGKREASRAGNQPWSSIPPVAASLVCTHPRRISMDIAAKLTSSFLKSYHPSTSIHHHLLGAAFTTVAARTTNFNPRECDLPSPCLLSITHCLPLVVPLHAAPKPSGDR